MCGICGQFNFVDGEPVNPLRIRRMSEAIAHRGPDDEGIFTDVSLGLGFRRLSIIDLAGGHQPMSDAEESVWVVFNGEIYNYPDLKEYLASRGHVFRTNSDTEVLIHGYKEWGLDVFDHLNGMFGVALWDRRRRRLVVARDAMGIKPVYYALGSGQLLFGSEIRAILAGADRTFDVDPDAVNLFLRYRFTPAPLTVYKGIHKLAAGTMLVVEAGAARVSRWYRFTPTPFEQPPKDAEAIECLTAIYQRATKRQLLSDVPVGLLLSGGLDSGLLLSLMSKAGRRWPTFTIGYGKSFKDDELVDAEATAAAFAADHTAVFLTREQFEGSLGRIIAQLEEPVAASSVVPMYFVSQRARQDVKVAINGQGPDELFGGYRRHVGVHYGSLWGGLPDWLRRGIGWGISNLPRHETLKRGLYSLDVPTRMQRYQQVLSLAPGEVIDSLFQPGVVTPGAGDKILDSWSDLEPLLESTDELGGFQFIELRSTLPDELLMYADKMSMAHGLEVRVPFLDREIVEYVERLGASFKMRRGKGKWLHREVCKRELRPAIVNRPKRGFAVNVVDQWFRTSMASSLSQRLLDNGSPMYSLLRSERVRHLLHEHQSGRSDYHKILFSIVALDQWLETRSRGSARATAPSVA
jgi:asparagine synthase (glutamine-hydrolysing)